MPDIVNDPNLASELDSLVSAPTPVEDQNLASELDSLASTPDNLTAPEPTRKLSPEELAANAEIWANAPKSSVSAARDELKSRLTEFRMLPAFTSAATSAWDKELVKENGVWKTPMLGITPDKDAGMLESLGLGMSAAVQGGLSKFFGAQTGSLDSEIKRLQKVHGLDDAQMQSAWSDLVNEYRTWEPDEKTRVLSDGTISLNPASRELLDTPAIEKIIDASNAPDTSKAAAKQNLPNLQTNAAQAKLEGYEAAATALKSPGGRAALLPFGVGGQAISATIEAPSEYAKRTGRKDTNTAAFMRDYERDVADGNPVMDFARGIATDWILGANNVAVQTLGNAGMLGSEKAGAVAAEGQDAASAITAGKPDTGITGQVVQQVLPIGAMMVATQLTGAAAALTGSEKVLGVVNSLSPVIYSGAQSAGAQYAQSRAEGKDHAAAQSDAAKAGATTALITGMFSAAGVGGVEDVAAGKQLAGVTIGDLIKSRGREEVVKNAKSFAGKLAKGFMEEAPEEGLDQLVSAFVNADPETNLSDAWQQAWDAGMVGGIMGTGTAAFTGNPEAAKTAIEIAPDLPDTAKALVEVTSVPKPFTVSDIPKVTNLPNAPETPTEKVVPEGVPEDGNVPTPSGSGVATPEPVAAMPEPAAPEAAVTPTPEPVVPESAGTETPLAAETPQPQTPTPQTDVQDERQRQRQGRQELLTPATEAPPVSAGGAVRDPKVAKEFESDLKMSGVAYDGDIRYSVQQSSDGTFRAERTVNGVREDMQDGLPSIEAAQQVIVDTFNGIEQTPFKVSQEVIKPEERKTTKELPPQGTISEGKDTIFGYDKEILLEAQRRGHLNKLVPPVDHMKAAEKILSDVKKFQIPVAKTVVENYGLSLPGYVLEGDTYVYQPQAPTTNENQVQETGRTAPVSAGGAVVSAQTDEQYLIDRIGPEDPTHPDYSAPDWKEIRDDMEKNGKTRDQAIRDAAESYRSSEAKQLAKEEAQRTKVRSSPEYQWVRDHAVMSPSEYVEKVTWSQAQERNPSLKPKDKKDFVSRVTKMNADMGDPLQIMTLRDAADALIPLSAEAVDTYGINLPEGYVKQGDLYVYQPQTPTTDENQVQETGGTPAVESVPTQPTAASETETGTALGSGQGQETVTPTPREKLLTELGTPKNPGFPDKVITPEGVAVELTQDGAKIKVSIETPPELRNTGKATAAMTRLVDLARRDGVTLDLDVVPMKDMPMSKEALTAWYSKLGFTDNGDGTMTFDPTRETAKPPTQETTKPAAETAKPKPVEPPMPHSVETLKTAFGVSDDVAVVTDVLAKAMGIDLAEVVYRRGGKPGSEAGSVALKQSENQFNNEVRTYVTGNWSADPEERRAELQRFAESWVERYRGATEDSGLRGIGVGISTDSIRGDAGSPTGRSVTSATPSGEVVIRIGSQVIDSMVGSGDEFAAKVRVAKDIQEEVFHAANIVAIMRRVGNNENVAARDVVQTYRDILGSIKNPTDEARVSEALRSSYTIYNNLDLAGMGLDPRDMSAAMLERTLPLGVKTNLVGELIRQVVQLHRSSDISETSYENAIEAATPWLQDSVAVLQEVARGNTDLGPLLARDIAETNAILDEASILYQRSPDTARFEELTSSIPANPTQADLDAWKATHPDEYQELKAMRERVLRAQGYDKTVFHGTTATTYVEGRDTPTNEAAKDGLKEIASRLGLSERWQDTANIIENWDKYGFLEERGATKQDILDARRFTDAMRGAPITRGRFMLGFDEFNMPEGDTELGIHVGSESSASLFGDVFQFQAKLGNTVRTKDLGTWSPNEVMDSLMLSKKVNFSEDEYDSVMQSDNPNAALRSLLKSKGVDSITYRNEVEGYGDSFILLDPADLKLDEPLSTDATGALITPDQWGDTGNPSILYQFAGENANVPQFMRDSLDTAKAMAAAGKPSEEIRAVTGWFPGKYDGKMRWEIPDNGAAANPLVEVIGTDGVQALRDGKTASAPLIEVLNHPALFEAYPDLANLNVVFDPNLDSYGRFEASNNAISIRQSDAFVGDRVLSTMLHEIQHAIQLKEGRSFGTDLQSGVWEAPDTQIESLRADAQKAFDTDPIDYSVEKYSDLLSKIRSSDATNLNEALATKDIEKAKGILGISDDSFGLELRLSQSYDRILSMVTNLDTDLRNQRYKLRNSKAVAENGSTEELRMLFLDYPGFAEKLYRMNAGEIEARDVQARAKLTPEQLKATAPYSSENIAPEAAIVLNQRGKGIKGSVEFLADGKALIRGFKSADASTGIHELTHVARRQLFDRSVPESQREGITDDDITTVEDFCGAKNGVWDEAAEEKFARANERYLYEGKAPSQLLAPIFAKMSAWLQKIYAQVKGSPIDIEISPAMRAVLDKLYQRGDVNQAIANTPPEPLVPEIPPVEFVEPEPLPPGRASHEMSDQERANLGLPPRIPQPTVTDSDVWATAQATEDAHRAAGKPGTAGTDLMHSKLANMEFTLDSKEQALIIHEIVTRRNTLSAAQRTLTSLPKNAPDLTKSEAQKAVTEAQEKYQEVLDFNDAIGSEEGRSFRMRRWIVALDYTYEGLSRRLHAAKNAHTTDNALTPQEIATAAEYAQKLEQAQARYDALVASTDEKLAESARLIEELTADVERAQKRDSATKSKVRKAVTDRAAEAKKRLQERGVTFLAQAQDIDAQTLKDFAAVAAEWLVDKPLTIAEFTQKLTATFGTWISDHAERIFKTAKQTYNETAASVTGKSAPSPEQVIAEIEQSDAEEPTRKEVWQLARAYVIAGVRGENVLDETHAALSELFNGLSRDRVAEIFTDYGITQHPSPDDATKELGRIKNLERIALKITDLKAGRIPKQTGYQRDPETINLEVRQLEREFRRLYKEEVEAGRIPDSGADGRAKSALASAKTRMRNEIEEIDDALRRNRAMASKKSSLTLDEEATQLRADLEAKRNEYNEAFPKEGLTDEKRREILIRNLDRQIAQETQMLADGILKKVKTAPVADTPEIAERRRKLAALRKERRDLYDAANPLREAKANTRRAIERLTAIIEKGRIDIKEKKQVNPDDELRALIETREALADEVDELRRASEEYQTRQIANALRAAEASLDRVSRKLASGDLSVPAKTITPASRDAAVQAIRARVKELNADLDARRREEKVGPYSDEARLTRELASLAKRKAELERRIREKDVSRKAKNLPLEDARKRRAQYEIELLKAEFSQMEERLVMKNAPLTKKAQYYGIGAANLLKIVTLGFDVGVVLRQLGTTYQALVSDLSVFSKNGDARKNGSHLARLIKTGVRAFADPAVESEIYEQVKNRPGAEYDNVGSKKIYFSPPFDTFSSTKEDIPRADLMKDIPWFVWPAIAGVKWFVFGMSPPAGVALVAVGALTKPLLTRLDRAQRAMTNVSRADFVDSARRAASAEGAISLKPSDYSVMNNAVMVATGRGQIKKLDPAIPIANVVLLATRFYLSRIMALSLQPLFAEGIFTPKESRAGMRARTEIAKMYARSIAGRASLYALLWAMLGRSDDEKEKKGTGLILNPFSNDFGRYRVNENLKVDFMSGINSFASITARYLGRRRYDATTEKYTALGGGFRNNVNEEATRFLSSKMNLLTKFLVDTHAGQYFGGKPVTVATAFEQASTAIITNDVVRVYEEMIGTYGKEEGTAKATAICLLMFGGMGASVRPSADEQRALKAMQKEIAKDEARRTRELNE